MTTAEMLLLICRIAELLKPEATWAEKLLVASVIMEADTKERGKGNVVKLARRSAR